jgi:hypothetical protein
MEPDDAPRDRYENSMCCTLAMGICCTPFAVKCMTIDISMRAVEDRGPVGADFMGSPAILECGCAARTCQSLTGICTSAVDAG